MRIRASQKSSFACTSWGLGELVQIQSDSRHGKCPRQICQPFLRFWPHCPHKGQGRALMAQVPCNIILETSDAPGPFESYCREAATAPEGEGPCPCVQRPLDGGEAEGGGHQRARLPGPLLGIRGYQHQLQQGSHLGMDHEYTQEVGERRRRPPRVWGRP